MKPREYGGCLPLELRKLNSDYFPGFDYVALNSGRSAIAYAAVAGGFKKVYIPYYTCKTVEAGLMDVTLPLSESADDEASSKLEICYYNIDSSFMPIEPEGGFDDRALFVYTNYFGIMTHVQQTDIISEHSHVLFDNTQGFYTKPIRGTYSAYSCRKFFGVPDGAFLVADNLPKLSYPTGKSADKADFLLKSIEEGPNAVYDISKENEEHINGEGLCYMSKLTKAIMDSIDLGSVEAKRVENFNRLHQLLGKYNELDIKLENGAPMVYPLLVDVDGVREHLVENKIFVPRWWRWIEESKDTNEFEKHLSKHLVPIPITQIYDLQDMDFIADVVIEKLNK